MGTEQNKAIVRRLYEEVINSGNLDLADGMVAVDVIEHEEFPGISDTGLAGFKAFFGMFRSAFPDLRFTVEDTIGEGDKVVCRIRMRGTHRGEFMDMAPTGNKIDLEAIDIMRLSGGKIAEHWGKTDTMLMMQQLGAE